MSKTALLMNISSIQKYVFASSKLKENLGASFLISDLFRRFINDNNEIINLPLKTNQEYDGYIGGGNALLFFSNKDKAIQFIEIFSRNLLVEAPATSVISAIDEWDDNNFITSRDRIFKKLRENKSKYLTQTVTQKQGISAECTSDGYSMDIFNSYVSEKAEYISAATNAKLKAYKNAERKLDDDYKELLKNKYSFTGELDKLGQTKGSENHIAIVHIDGNSMGDRFKSLKTLTETKQLSKDVENAVNESFKILIKHIINDLEDKVKSDFLSIKKDKDKKQILPIRPIIMGGDDITFVCDGRMGIYYSKIFMKAFKEQNDSNNKSLNLSSCAGIAVTKTSYPFYKGYQIAEELCANAKNKRRTLGGEGSWLDFHIAYGGFSGSLSDIRIKNFNVNMGSLIFRPFIMENNSKYSFDNIINASKLLKKEVAKNKIKELREVLTLGKDAIGQFVNELDARNKNLPDINSEKYNKELFIKRETPYFDMIELLEYYPKYELE